MSSRCERWLTLTLAPKATSCTLTSWWCRRCASASPAAGAAGATISCPAALQPGTFLVAASAAVQQKARRVPAPPAAGRVAPTRGICSALNSVTCTSPGRRASLR